MPRIALVYPRANLDTVPSLTGALEILAERGYTLDVYTYLTAGQAPPRFASPRIRLRSLGTEGVAEATTAGLRSVARRAGWLRGSVLHKPLVRGYAAVGAGLAHGSRLLARARAVDRGAAYRCVIAVDADGLALADSLGFDAPLACYSLELLLSRELSSESDRRLKEQERRLLQAAPFVVVQDEQRGRLLAEDNHLGWDRLVLVPNAPLGPARRRRSGFWHRRFGLSADQRVVLHSGSLGDWTGIEAILDSVPTWPDDWVLVVHTRYDAESSAYVDALRAAASDRVSFSLKPVPRDAYDDLIDGADVGLAFYVASRDSPYTGTNIQTIGLSSGKVAYALRAGLPVIVNAEASIAAQLSEAGCGYAVEDASGISAALEAIAADYAGYSQRACAFFDRHLDFGRAFEAVVQRIEALPT